MQNIHGRIGLALTMLIVAGCELGEVAPAAQPALRVLDPRDEALVSVTPDGLHVDATARLLDDLSVGDVIVSSGAEPFLRKVTSIESDGDQIALVTEPGTLTDAIFDGEMHSSGDLFARDWQQGSGDEFVIAVDRLAMDFANTTLLQEGDIKVEINRGSVRFRPSLDVDVQVADGWVSHFHSVVRGELSASMSVKITAARGFERSFSKTIWKSPAYRVTQMVGIVPVVEVVQVSLIASGDAHASVSGTVELGNATASASMEAGASYDRGNWRAISKPSITLNAGGPATTVNATARASLKLSVRVDVKLYDVAGPHITLGAYARTAVASTTGWTGRVGIDGEFGGDVSVLGNTLASYNKKLFDVGRSF